MTIFRFSFAPTVLSILASCGVAQDDGDNSEVRQRIEAKPLYQAKIERAGKVVDAPELLRLHKDNPNRLAINNRGKSFVVSAKILEIPEFNEELDRISGYYLRLQVRDEQSLDAGLVEDIVARDKGWPKIGSISLFVKNFSQEKAARLSKGQLIRAKCPSLRIVQDGLIFDDCTLEAA